MARGISVGKQGRQNARFVKNDFRTRVCFGFSKIVIHLKTSGVKMIAPPSLLFFVWHTFPRCKHNKMIIIFGFCCFGLA
jgi:hypothetical protein